MNLRFCEQPPYRAFKNVNHLTTLKLGEGLETIGNYAFANCPYLLSVYAHMEFPPEISGCGDLSTIDLYVPQESIIYYRRASVWHLFNLHNMPSEDIENITENLSPEGKILRNGQLFILRGNNIYTITGQKVN